MAQQQIQDRVRELRSMTERLQNSLCERGEEEKEEVVEEEEEDRSYNTIHKMEQIKNDLIRI